MAEPKSEKIRQLKEKRKVLVAELHLEQETVTNARARIKQINQQMTDLAAQIKDLSHKVNGITVTDHALVRYLERVHGLDVESIKRDMVTEALNQTVDKLGGTGKFPTGECRAVLEGYTWVTVEASAGGDQAR